MNPYQMYSGYGPQQADYSMIYPYQIPAYSYGQNVDRQPLERRVSALERQNDQQAREINRLNQQVTRLNQEVNRLNQVQERQARRLNRLNQRLRAVENRLSIPFLAEDGF
ncbi:hypothetical protein ACQCVE_04815 [Metabacillus sp. 113a]|uniref:hypothetical protein n=1 Tax=Metabacillus sp. 113a TaxID=3404706 RepID=UPI003CEAB0C5